MTESNPPSPPNPLGQIPLRRLWYGVLALLVLVVVYVLRVSLTSTDANPVRQNGKTMGSTYAYSYFPPTREFSESERAALHESVEALLEDFEGKLSTYRPESPQSKFNVTRSTDWLAVPAELITLLEVARVIGDRSGGVLDLTISPLVRVWGFGAAKKRAEPPSDAEIAKAKTLVDQRGLLIDSKNARMKKSMPEMEIDNNSIAPGYAADLVGELFESQGITRYLVDIGGEIRARGERGSGQGWIVGVETPSEVYAQGVQVRVELRDLSLATSGNYRNYFEKDGVRYSHVLDPRTGRPIRHRLASVTVLHEKAIWADAWSTALFVLGPERGMELAEKEGLDAMMLVARDGGSGSDGRSGSGSGFEMQMTPGFKSRTLEGGR